MYEKQTSSYVYTRRSRRYQKFDSLKMSIILISFSIIALISLWLPVLFAPSPLSGS